MASTVATAAATILMAIFTYFLWRVNEKLTGIQFNAERRNDAIVEVKQVRPTVTGPMQDKGVRFRIWNSGLRHTHIVDAHLKHAGLNGTDERTELKFWWHKRDYRDHKLGNDPYTAPISFHFIGERLESGQMWEVEAQTAEDRGIRAYREPRIVVEPVLGHPVEFKVDDPLMRASEEEIHRPESKVAAEP